MEHAPGQQDTLIGVNKDISELLDHDCVKGVLESVTSVHYQASSAWQYCLGVLSQGDVASCSVSGYGAMLSYVALRLRC